MKSRSFFMLVLAVFMIFTLAACGVSNSNSSSTAAAVDTATSGGGSNSGGDKASETASNSKAASDTGKPVTLRIAWWGDQARHQKTIKVLNMYEKLHPNIKFQYEYTSYDGYWDKLAAEAAGKRLPDIMQQNFGEHMNNYASKGLLADLSGYVQDGTIDMSDVAQSIVDSGKVNGKLLGIVLGTNALSTLYDPALFKKAGIPEPKAGWTWDDLMNDALKLSKTTGKYGIENMDTTRYFEYYLRQHGMRLFNPDGTDLGYTDDSLLSDYWNIKLKMVKDGAAPPLSVANQHTATDNSLLVLGQAGMELQWSNGIVGLQAAAKRPLKMALLPGPNADQGLYLKPSQFFSITTNSQHKLEAAQFISWFTNSVDANKVLAAERGVPISAKVRDALKPTLGASEQTEFDYISLAADHSSPIDKNQPPTATQVLDTLKKLDEKVLYQKETPEQAAKDFRQQAETILQGK